MNYIFPSTFDDYYSWVEFSEDLRRHWESTCDWNKYPPERWIEIFPEMRDRVSELYLESEDLLTRLRSDYINTEQFFSQDLNTRLIEEAWLDETLGKTVKRLETKVWIYKRMMAACNPVEVVGPVTDREITLAREYPIVNLLPEQPKRGFIHCPFHTEKTPSCKVFTDHIHCYGCGKHLDTIGYLMETEGKSFINSVKYLCHI